MAADALQRIGVHLVTAAELREMRAQLRPLGLPAAYPHVHVVALGEDPAVPARDRPELDHREAAILLLEGSVALVGDAVDDRATEPERLCGRAVRAVRADQDLRLDLAPVEPHGQLRLR